MTRTKQWSIWIRTAPAFVFGSIALLTLAFPGAWLLVDKTEFFKATMFAGGVQLFGVIGGGGWFALAGSVERLLEVLPSLNSSDRRRARGLIRAAGVWVCSYCCIWAIWVPLFATDRLPYRHPIFWVTAGSLWCAGLWATLSIRRRTNECLRRVQSSASPESPVASS